MRTTSVPGSRTGTWAGQITIETSTRREFGHRSIASPACGERLPYVLHQEDEVEFISGRGFEFWDQVKVEVVGLWGLSVDE